MKQVKISIIVPIYNAVKCIDTTIKSILNQTVKDIEIILVNDGSTDESLDICLVYEKIDKRVKVINKYNSGVSDTRNFGIQHSTGKYITFVDADDILEENMLEILMNDLEESLADLSVCGYFEEKISGGTMINRVPKKYFEKKTITIDEIKKYIVDFHKSDQLNPIWNKLYKTHIIKDNKILFPTDISVGEDLIFNLEYIKKIDVISFTDICLYHYIRKDNNSLTNNYNENIFSNSLFIIEQMKKFFNYIGYCNKNMEYLTKVLYKSIFFSFFNLYHIECPKNFREKKQYIAMIILEESKYRFGKHIFLDDIKTIIVFILLKIKSKLFIMIIFSILSKLGGCFKVWKSKLVL